MLSDAGYAFSVASFTQKNLDVFLAITFVLGVMFDKVACFPFGDAEDLDLYFEDSLLDGVLGNASFFLHWIAHRSRKKLFYGKGGEFSTGLADFMLSVCFFDDPREDWQCS